VGIFPDIFTEMGVLLLLAAAVVTAYGSAEAARLEQQRVVV